MQKIFRYAAIVVLSGAIFAAPVRAQSSSVVVGTDPAGDWGPAMAGAGHSLGQDLVSASIRALDPSTLEFTIGVTSLPPVDVVSSPQAAYVWDFTVDGDWWRLTNFPCEPSAANGWSCVPMPTTGTDPLDLALDQTRFELLDCAPRLVSGFAPCTPVAAPLATMDDSAGTISIPVTMDLIRARPFSIIATPDELDWDVFASLTPAEAPPRDELVITETFRVPRF